MKTYTEALAKLNGRDKRKLENNTYLEKRINGIAVRLHNTDVILYQPDGNIILNSNGWHTVTTKDHLNKYSPAHVHQKNYKWFQGPYAFRDGMILTPSGQVICTPEFATGL